MKNIAKPVLYALIGSACLYVLFSLGSLAYRLTGERPVGPIGEGIVGGALIIGMMVVFVLLLWSCYEIGRFIMEKLL